MTRIYLEVDRNVAVAYSSDDIDDVKSIGRGTREEFDIWAKGRNLYILPENLSMYENRAKMLIEYHLTDLDSVEFLLRFA